MTPFLGCFFGFGCDSIATYCFLCAFFCAVIFLILFVRSTKCKSLYTSRKLTIKYDFIYIILYNKMKESVPLICANNSRMFILNVVRTSIFSITALRQVQIFILLIITITTIIITIENNHTIFLCQMWNHCVCLVCAWFVLGLCLVCAWVSWVMLCDCDTISYCIWSVAFVLMICSSTGMWYIWTVKQSIQYQYQRNNIAIRIARITIVTFCFSLLVIVFPFVFSFVLLAMFWIRIIMCIFNCFWLNSFVFGII